MNSITKHIVIGALTRIVAASWLVETVGRKGENRIMGMPWRPSALWRLCITLQNAEKALAAFVDGACTRLGIDIEDVLYPLIVARTQSDAS